MTYHGVTQNLVIDIGENGIGSSKLISEVHGAIAGS